MADLYSAASDAARRMGVPGDAFNAIISGIGSAIAGQLKSGKVRWCPNFRCESSNGSFHAVVCGLTTVRCAAVPWHLLHRCNWRSIVLWCSCYDETYNEAARCAPFLCCPDCNPQNTVLLVTLLQPRLVD